MLRIVRRAIKHYGAVAAERHNRLFKPESAQLIERVTPVERVPIIILRFRDAEQLRHLMLVDEQDVGGLDQLHRQGRGERRVVEQHLHARFVAHACGRGDGFDGAFQAQAEHCGVGQRVTHGFNVVDGHLRVGAGRVHDGVLAVRVHGDDGGAGRAEHAAHVRGVDARFAERSEQEVGVVVGADRAEHLHGGADACGRRGLVAGFAAGQQL